MSPLVILLGKNTLFVFYYFFILSLQFLILKRIKKNKHSVGSHAPWEKSKDQALTEH